MTEQEWGIIAEGLHSGFPLCCIRWFMEVWSPNTLAAFFAKDDVALRAWAFYMDALERLEQELGRAIDYIPCPDCFEAGVVVETLSCACRFPGPKSWASAPV